MKVYIFLIPSKFFKEPSKAELRHRNRKEALKKIICDHKFVI